MFPAFTHNNGTDRPPQNISNYWWVLCDIPEERSPCLQNGGSL